MTESVLEKIHRLYGPDQSTATIEDCAQWLREHGYNSLANLMEGK